MNRWPAGPLALLAAALCGCASTATVTRGGGAGIEAVMALPAHGEHYRIAVGGIIDKSDAAAPRSLVHQLSVLNTARISEHHLQPGGITAALGDMLATELFQSGRFVVLDRAALDDIFLEQAFADSDDAAEHTRLPLGELEGAELLLVGALTAFDAGLDGAALPVPIPLNDRGDFGLLNLRYARGYVAADFRVIDVRTGRIVDSVAVEGRNSRFGMDFGFYSFRRHRHVELPGVLTYFRNTPVEEALQKMVTAAIAEVAQRAAAP